MPIEVTVRHQEVKPGVQTYVWEKARELVDEFPEIERVHVILDVQKRTQLAEVVLHAKHHIRAEAKEGADKLVVAVDSAIEKVEKQLRRQYDKIKDHGASMKRKEIIRDRGTDEA